MGAPCTFILLAGVPAPTTRERIRCTGRRDLPLHQSPRRPRHHLPLLPLGARHRRYRRLRQHLPRRLPGALLMIPGPAWFRLGPCPGRPPLRSALLQLTRVPGRRVFAPTLVPLDSSASAPRRTPTTPPRPTTTGGCHTCHISTPRCFSLRLSSCRLLQLPRCINRPPLLHRAGTNLRSCRP